MNRLIPLGLLLVVSSSATAETWVTDFNAAHDQAQLSAKPMLVYVFDGR